MPGVPRGAGNACRGRAPHGGLAAGCRPAISAPPSGTSPPRSSSRPAFYPAEAGLGYVALASKKQQGGAAALRSRGGGQSAIRAGARRPRRGAARAGRARRRRCRASRPRSQADPSLTALRSRIDVLRFRGQQQDDRRPRARRREAGQLDEARGAYTRAIAASPDSPFLYRELADVERRAGRPGCGARARAAGSGARARRAAHPRAARGDLEAQGDCGESRRGVQRRRWRSSQTRRLKRRIDELRDAAAFAAMPPEYRAIESSPAVTRAQLAALFGVQLEPLLSSARNATRSSSPTRAATGPRPGSCRSRAPA